MAGDFVLTWMVPPVHRPPNCGEWPNSEYDPSGSCSLNVPLGPTVTSVALPPEPVKVTTPDIGRGRPGGGPPANTNVPVTLPRTGPDVEEAPPQPAAIAMKRASGTPNHFASIFSPWMLRTSSPKSPTSLTSERFVQLTSSPLLLTQPPGGALAQGAKSSNSL